MCGSISAIYSFSVWCSVYVPMYTVHTCVCMDLHCMCACCTRFIVYTYTLLSEKWLQRIVQPNEYSMFSIHAGPQCSMYCPSIRSTWSSAGRVIHMQNTICVGILGILHARPLTASQGPRWSWYYQAMAFRVLPKPLCPCTHAHQPL